MAFYLVKEKMFLLFSEGEVKDDWCYRTLTMPALIEPIDTEERSLNEKECGRLKGFLENIKSLKIFPGTPASDSGDDAAVKPDEPLDWNLKVTLGMVCSYANNRDFVTITSPNKDNFLERFKLFLAAYGLKLKIVVKLNKLAYVQISNGAASTTVDYVVSKETDLDQITSSHGAQLSFSGYWHRSYWHPKYKCEFKGVISISCLLCSPVSRLNSMIAEKMSTVIQNILNGDINSDAVIIAKDCVSVKCHKAFLSAQSAVFETMFNNENYEESKTSSVEMPDMTEDGVKAFLNYLYLRNDEKADENCGIALELLQAGHKYDIPSLEKSMKTILLAKPDEWYQVDVSIKLFLFARNIPDGDELKMRSIMQLKQNFAILKTSPTYKQLFRGDPDAAMELCEYAFSI